MRCVAGAQNKFASYYASMRIRIVLCLVVTENHCRIGWCQTLSGRAGSVRPLIYVNPWPALNNRRHRRTEYDKHEKPTPNGIGVRIEWAGFGDGFRIECTTLLAGRMARDNTLVYV